MTELTGAPAIPAAAALTSRWRLPHWLAWVIFALISALAAAYLVYTEFPSAPLILEPDPFGGVNANAIRRDFGSFLVAAAITAAIASLIVLAARRALFALMAVMFLLLIVVISSSVKMHHMNMNVHAYDLVFYLSSYSTLSFLWSDYKGYIFGFAGMITAAGLIGWALFRADPTRVARHVAALAFAAFVGLAFWGISLRGERRHLQFFFKDIMFVSSFYASWAETIETMWRGTLMVAAPSAPGPAFAATGTCATPARKPHIILVHQESVVQPGLFPALAYDPRMDSHFKSYDGKTHVMRVETYGGASWLTEFSILAGVSTHSFGGMRQFVQTLMSGKLKDTLPQVLEQCGYRNTVFYPMYRNFVSNARFYSSIGMKEVFDQGDQRAKSSMERDKFYYKNALDEMDRHFTKTDQPFFTFVQTMATHWPYDFVYPADPGEEVPVPDNPLPELKEYLRRLFMAKLDLEFLKSELKRRFPEQQFLLVSYGDHHPVATRHLIGYKDETDAEDVQLPGDHVGFLTYYAVEGINFEPGPLPSQEIVDVPYLGTIILGAARLPLSGAHQERVRLLNLCDGRYWSCKHHDQILAFHRRLIDSKLMEAR